MRLDNFLYLISISSLFPNLILAFTEFPRKVYIGELELDYGNLRIAFQYIWICIFLLLFNLVKLFMKTKSKNYVLLVFALMAFLQTLSAAHLQSYFIESIELMKETPYLALRLALNLLGFLFTLSLLVSQSIIIINDWKNTDKAKTYLK